MNYNNSVADRVNELCNHLMKAGYKDAALEVAIKFSELNDEVEIKVPPLTQLWVSQQVDFGNPSTMALLHRDLEVLKRREEYRRGYFEKLIAPYGMLLMQSVN